MATLLITHPQFVAHDTGYGHPERSDRMRAIDQALEHDSFQALVREEAHMPDDVLKNIALAHDDDYIEKIQSARPSGSDGLVRLDPDTVMSSGSWEAALRAVGAGIMAVDKVLDAGSGIKNAFCQVRPPGHHAETARVMGFCLFNNIAVAAEYARKKYGLERVAVVDFDVHHGNGTQEIFWSDKNLFYGSTHEMPLFPGTGAVNETGVGNICNAPLRAGDDGKAFKAAMEGRVLQALEAFSPDLLMISAGFDAHEADMLANLRLVEADFMWATEQLCDVADKVCGGRVVSMLEGGYDLEALAQSVGVHLRTLMDVGA